MGPKIDATERRVHRRIAAPVRAHQILANGDRREIPVRDISQGGIFLFTPTLLAPVGDELMLEIALPNSTHLVRLQAEVARAVQDGEGPALLGMGMRFMVLDREQQLALDLLMERLLEGSGGERRAYPRISHRLLVRCPGAEGLEAVLRDLSHGGAGLWVNQPLTFGRQITLEMQRAKKGPLCLPGRVVGIFPGREGEPFRQVGVQFDQLPPALQAELDAFLEELVLNS